MLGNGPKVFPPCVNQSDWPDGDLDIAALEDGTDGDDGKGDLPINKVQFKFLFHITYKFSKN